MLFKWNSLRPGLSLSLNRARASAIELHELQPSDASAICCMEPVKRSLESIDLCWRDMSEDCLARNVIMFVSCFSKSVSEPHLKPNMNCEKTLAGSLVKALHKVLQKVLKRKELKEKRRETHFKSIENSFEKHWPLWSPIGKMLALGQRAPGDKWRKMLSALESLGNRPRNSMNHFGIAAVCNSMCNSTLYSMLSRLSRFSEISPSESTASDPSSRSAAWLQPWPSEKTHPRRNDCSLSSFLKKRKTSRPWRLEGLH